MAFKVAKRTSSLRTKFYLDISIVDKRWGFIRPTSKTVAAATLNSRASLIRFPASIPWYSP